MNTSCFGSEGALDYFSQTHQLRFQQILTKETTSAHPESGFPTNDDNRCMLSLSKNNFLHPGEIFLFLKNKQKQKTHKLSCYHYGVESIGQQFLFYSTLGRKSTLHHFWAPVKTVSKNSFVRSARVSQSGLSRRNAQYYWPCRVQQHYLQPAHALLSEDITLQSKVCRWKQHFPVLHETPT